MAKSWLKTIGALKRFLNEVGPLWPNSTKLSGYASTGPYHCGDCIYLRKSGAESFKDADGKGRCHHPVVIADSEVKKDENLIPIINIEHGCCEFVEYEKGYVEESSDKD
jgi:hypothetical protein